MKEEIKPLISFDELIEFGMIKETDEANALICPMYKQLFEPEEGQEFGLSIGCWLVDQQYNLAIITPNADAIILGAVESIEQLKVIEKSITGFDPS